MDQRLRPIERLETASEYRRVFDGGRYYRTPELQVHCAPGAGDFSRLGLVVSRKRGNAPVRNRIKRLLRDVFRCHKHELPQILDVVLVPRGEGARSRASYEASFSRFLEMLRSGDAGAQGPRTRGPARRSRRGAETTKRAQPR